MTYRSGSAFRVSSDPFVVVAAFTCDECRRMVTASASTQPTNSIYQDDAAHLWQVMHPTHHAEWDWQPKTVLGKVFPDIPEHIGNAASEAFSASVSRRIEPPS